MSNNGVPLKSELEVIQGESVSWKV